MVNSWVPSATCSLDHDRYNMCSKRSIHAHHLGTPKKPVTVRVFFFGAKVTTFEHLFLIFLVSNKSFTVHLREYALGIGIRGRFS